MAQLSSSAQQKGPAQVHAGRINALAAARIDGRPLAVSAGDDASLGIWDLDTEQMTGRISGPQSTAFAVALAEFDARPIVVSGWGDGVVRVHDLLTGETIGDPLARHRPGSYVTAVVVAEVQGQKLVLSADTVGEIHIWDLKALAPVGAPLAGHTPGVPVFDLAVGWEGKTFLASVSRDGSTVVWDVEKRSRNWSHDRGKWGTPGIASLTAAAIWEAAARPVLASGSSDGTLYLEDLVMGSAVTTLEGLPGFTALEAATLNGKRALVSGHDDGTLRFWEEHGREPRVLTSAQDRVDAIGLLESEDGRIPIVVVGGEDGRVWRWEPLSDTTSPQTGGQPDKVEWLTDAPADDDLLYRRPLAQALGRRLARIHEQDPTNAFLVHLDGAWGTGKSTILRFLRSSLEPDWLVVEFDAWRQSRVGPPWWALLVALRERLASDLTPFARARLRTAECWARIRRTGAPYFFALAVLVLAILGVVLALGPPSLTWQGVGETAKSVTAIVAGLGTLWAGGLLASRFLLWDSAKGAAVYEQTKANPMEALADHFGWLLARAGKPVAFFVDDLDRCSGDYVVELLEALQTLIRDAPRRLEEASGGPYFVVAADGTWLRRSFEVRYEQFGASVTEPGRPLGYLFLDKLFQLSVTVPTVTSHEKGLYLAGLLRVRAGDGPSADEVDAVREQLRQSTTDDQVIGALQTASPATRRALAPEAIDKLSDPAIEEATEHSLQGFAQLLEPNPRAMKRFVNAYGIARVILTLENALVPSDSLALWTILRSRWPVLAEQLAKDPELVTCISNGSPPPPGVRDEVRELFTAPQVRELVAFPRGGPMTPATVRACAAGALPVPVGG